MGRDLPDGAEDAPAVVKMACRCPGDPDGLRAELFGGRSVGEYTPWSPPGVIPLADAVRLIRRRGALMRRCAPVEGGGMDALVLDSAEKSGAPAIAAAPGFEEASRNPPRQPAVSGTTAEPDRLRRPRRGNPRPWTTCR